jgi:hypothetical protein
MAQRKGRAPLSCPHFAAPSINPALPELQASAEGAPREAAPRCACCGGESPGGPARRKALAVNDWIVGLALRRYAERNLT